MRWWIIIVGIVIYIIIRFAIDYAKMNSGMKKKGGIRAVYATLINGLISKYPNIKVVKETPTSIEFNLNFTTCGLNGIYGIFVNYAFDALNVQIFLKPGSAKPAKLIDKDFDHSFTQEQILDAITEFIGV